MREQCQLDWEAEDLGMPHSTAGAAEAAGAAGKEEGAKEEDAATDKASAMLATLDLAAEGGCWGWVVVSWQVGRGRGAGFWDEWLHRGSGWLMISRRRVGGWLLGVGGTISLEGGCRVGVVARCLERMPAGGRSWCGMVVQWRTPHGSR